MVGGDPTLFNRSERTRMQHLSEEMRIATGGGGSMNINRDQMVFASKKDSLTHKNSSDKMSLAGEQED